MKKLGIVGGLGWLSTVDYYGSLCRRAEARHRESGASGLPPMPEISIESLNIAHALSLTGQDGDERSWGRFDAYHREALFRLERSGAQVALMAANTPHHRYEAIVRGVGIPVLNLFDLLAETAVERGFKQVLLLGTSTVMGSQVALKAFADKAVPARFPDPAMKHAVIELLHAIHSGRSEGVAERFRALVAPVASADASVCVALACTELPGLFPKHLEDAVFNDGGITYMNSLQVHVVAAFQWMLRPA